MRTRVIAIANQKGGVGKTTTTHAFASGLTKRGYRVLAIDLDPQGNLSNSVGVDVASVNTVFELLTKEIPIEKAIHHYPVFDIIPSGLRLADAEQTFTKIGKEQRLKESLSPVMENYDFIVIDTPPSLGILTMNALTVAKELIIPTTAGIYAASGIAQLNETIGNIRTYCNDELVISGILLTRYNPRAINNKKMKELTMVIAEHIGAPIFNTYIRSSIVVEEAQAQQMDLFSYKGNSTVAEDYDLFISEYIERRK